MKLCFRCRTYYYDFRIPICVAYCHGREGHLVPGGQLGAGDHRVLADLVQEVHEAAEGGEEAEEKQDQPGRVG